MTREEAIAMVRKYGAAAGDHCRAGMAEHGVDLVEALISEPIVEYAIAYSGGSMLVRPNDIEDIWPIVEWVEAYQRHGGKVYRRRVIVVSDWELVPK